MIRADQVATLGASAEQDAGNADLTKGLRLLFRRFAIASGRLQGALIVYERNERLQGKLPFAKEPDSQG